MAGGEKLRFTINIGNTHISVCEWQDDVLTAWPTIDADSDGARKIAEQIEQTDTPVDAVLISSVVPALKAPMIKFLQEHASRVYVFRKDIIPPIDIIPEPAAKVGDDRIAVALGALAIDPAVPWVVADVGTAMTCNAVSPGPPARFEGGLITPGAAMSLSAMSEQTAQLPEMQSTTQKLLSKVDYIGRSTEEAMQWGVLVAQAATLSAMIDGQARRLGKGTRVALTGGGAAIVERVMKKLALPIPAIHTDPQLLHRGLAETWKRGLRP
jgi:pantothenate kinase type III